jgi:hypothetical protein
VRALVCAFAVVASIGAFVAQPASAATRLSAADRKAIGVLMDRFVKDAVRREDLPAAWSLIGPDLRGGTTRAAWNNGSGVTVQYFPVAGTDFSNAWTVSAVRAGAAQLQMILHPKPGAHGYEETAANIEVRKVHGRWIVDIFYPAAVFHANGGISGPNDFKAGSGSGATNSSRIAGRWLIVAIGAVGSIVLLLPIGIWLRVKLRDRRAWADYSKAHPEG